MKKMKFDTMIDSILLKEGTISNEERYSSHIAAK